MRIYLQTMPLGATPPRYYHLHLEQDLLDGWNVVKEYGYQGSSGRVIRMHYDCRDDAQEALLMARDAQVARGYRVVFIQGMEPPRASPARNS